MEVKKMQTEIGQFYVDKDLKNSFLEIREVKPDGWCKVTFNFRRLNPTLYNYHTAYLEAFYELVPPAPTQE